MKTFIRVRLEGMEVVEFDINKVQGYKVLFHDEAGIYLLTVQLPSGDIVIKAGEVDECHQILNQLHDFQDIKIVDL